MIRKIEVRCTPDGAVARVFEDTNGAPTTYECVRDPTHRWLVKAVVSIDGRHFERTPTRLPPEYARDEICRALEEACGAW